MKHPYAWGSPPTEVSRRQWMQTLFGATVTGGLLSPPVQHRSVSSKNASTLS